MMADIDKVYKGLYCCRNSYPKDCKHCPYEPDCTHHETCDLLIQNALSIVGEYWANQNDQPQIVRCEDCKRLGYTNSHWFCKLLNRCVDADWFCADGERRSE